MMATSKIKDDRQIIFQLECEIFDYAIAEYIGHTALIIYIALCHHIQNNTDFPSLSQLMARCDLDKKAINKAMQVLMQYHLIEINHQPQGKTYIVKSVQEAIQKNNWHKLAPINAPIEEPEIAELEPPALIFKTPPNPSQLPEPPPIESYTPPPTSPEPPIKLITTRDCPYCNERGMIRFSDEISGHFDSYSCNHEFDKIKAFAAKRRVKVTSAKAGYEYPAGEPVKIIPTNYIPDP